MSMSNYLVPHHSACQEQKVSCKNHGVLTTVTSQTEKKKSEIPGLT